MRQLQTFLTILTISSVLSSLAMAQARIASRNTDAVVAAKIEAALHDETRLEFIETPLADVAEFLSKMHDIEVYLDSRGLDDVGIGSDTPVTSNLKGVTLRSALRLTLRDLQLTYTIENGGLKITTPEVAESELVNQVYPVSELLERTDSGHFDYDALIQSIESMVEVSSWESVGGPGSINGVLGNIVIAQTNHGHDQVHEFLHAFRRVRKALAKSDGKPQFISELMSNSANAERIRRQLDSKIKAEFVETPLSDVVDYFSQVADIPIVINVAALEDLGLSSDVPMTLHTKQGRLQDMLRRVLNPLDLTFVVADETLQITTAEEAESQLGVRFYPIGDMLAGDEEAKADLGDRIVDIITSSVSPDSWDQVGGPASIFVMSPNILTISQVEANHNQIATLISNLRKQGVHSNADGKRMSRRVFPLIFDKVDVDPKTMEDLAAKLPKMLPNIDWNAKGASIQHFGRSLVVTNTRRAHQALNQLLTEMRLVPSPAATGGGGRGGMFGGIIREQKIARTR